MDIHCHTHLEKADRIVQSLNNPKTDPIFGFTSEKSREVNRQQMAIADDGTCREKIRSFRLEPFRA